MRFSTIENRIFFSDNFLISYYTGQHLGLRHPISHLFFTGQLAHQVSSLYWFPSFSYAGWPGHAGLIQPRYPHRLLPEDQNILLQRPLIRQRSAWLTHSRINPGGYARLRADMALRPEGDAPCFNRASTVLMP